jgi:hypothetical protein
MGLYSALERQCFGICLRLWQRSKQKDNMFIGSWHIFSFQSSSLSNLLALTQRSKRKK